MMSCFTTMRLWLFAFALAFAPLPSVRADAENAPSFLSVIPGLAEQHLDAEYWVARTEHPDHLRYSADQINALNAHQLATDPSMHDLRALPKTLRRKQVRRWIEALSSRPTKTLFSNSQPIPDAQIDEWMNALALDLIPKRSVTEFGVVVRRTALRTFPTNHVVFDTADGRDIDRFQESAFFPETPVVIAHRSRDRLWYFVIGERYAAWTSAINVVKSNRDDALGAAAQSPALIVAGAHVQAVSFVESSLTFDMGTRLQLDTKWQPHHVIGGQLALAHYVIKLLGHSRHGGALYRTALIPRNADVHLGPLPHTAANILRQSFKFLGERYGWGHADNGRDCSGFVSEVYASMGITLPRNTGDQNRSTAFDRIALGPDVDHAARLEIFGMLAVGDLIFIPGHVMMVIGQQDDGPWVIHDAYNIAVRHPDASITSYKANGVIVTPFSVLSLDTGVSYIDAATAIQRIGSRETQ